MIITETVESFDGSFGVFAVFVADEGKSSRLTRILILLREF